MSRFSLPGSHRNRSTVLGRWRWIILLCAAIAAVMWKTQSAISTMPKRGLAAAGHAAGGIENRFEHIGDIGTAVADRPVANESGKDESDTSQPSRVAPDAFGVVVTDAAPAGLEATGQWAKGDGSTTCPDDYSIKGNASSRIYHLPGEPSYSKAIAEICFATEDDAQAAGFRARAK